MVVFFLLVIGVVDHFFVFVSSLSWDDVHSASFSFVCVCVCFELSQDPIRLDSREAELVSPEKARKD